MTNRRIKQYCEEINSINKEIRDLEDDYSDRSQEINLKRIEIMKVYSEWQAYQKGFHAGIRYAKKKFAEDVKDGEENEKDN